MWLHKATYWAQVFSSPLSISTANLHCTGKSHLLFLNIFSLNCRTVLAQIEARAQLVLEKQLNDYKITMTPPTDTLEDYVRQWKAACFGTCFFREFAKEGGISRTNDFEQQHGSEQAMKRVLYRFVLTLFFHPSFLSHEVSISLQPCSFE